MKEGKDEGMKKRRGKEKKGQRKGGTKKRRDEEKEGSGIGRIQDWRET